MSRKLEDGTLAETLGDEAQGMVVVDYDGHPQKYDAVEIMLQFVAKEVNVLKIDIPRAGGKGWKRAHSEIDTQDAGPRRRLVRSGVVRGEVRPRGDVG